MKCINIILIEYDKQTIMNLCPNYSKKSKHKLKLMYKTIWKLITFIVGDEIGSQDIVESNVLNIFLFNDIKLK